MRATVLIVDDEQNVLDGLSQALRKSDYEVKTETGARAALERLRTEQVDIVVSDFLMPEMSGIEFLGLVHDRQPHAVRIILTGNADTELAIRAINEGEIFRFLRKPCDRTELLVTLHVAVEKLELERENRQLRSLILRHPELRAEWESLRSDRSGAETAPGRSPDPRSH